MKNLITLLILTFTTLIVNSQTKQNYSGNFSGNTTNGKATYTYYEGDNYQRIYDGNFSYIASTPTVKIEINGDFKDGLRNKIWSTNVQLLKPLGRTVGMTEKSTLNFSDGKLNGNATYFSELKEKWSGGVASTTTSISANFMNGLFVNKISAIFKNTGIMTVAIDGQFDEQGYMHGKWEIQYHERRNSFEDIKNSPIIKDVREYQHGVLSKNKIIKTSTGEILDQYDNSEIVENFFKNFDKEANISIFNDKIYEVSDIIDGSHVGFGYGNEHLTDLFSWWKTKNNNNNMLFEISIGVEAPRMIVERTIKEIDVISVAVSFAQEGDFENAIKFTEFALKSNESDVEINNVLGMYLIFNKQFEESETQLEKTYRLCRGNCELLLQVERNLSHAYTLNNHYDKALEIHKRNLDKTIDNEKWLDVIHKDFERLEYNGITNPNFDKLDEDIKRYNYQKIIDKADLAFNNNSLENAKILYKEALSIFPSEEYPKKQIDAIYEKEKCAELIANADDYYNKKNYKEAKANYKAALEIEESEYARQKIKKINSSRVMTSVYYIGAAVLIAAGAYFGLL